MKHFFVVSLALVASTAAADPSQWTSRNGGRYTQFVPPSNDGTEVRVYGAEAASDRDAWLRTHRGRGPDGVTLAGAYQTVASPQASVDVAFARGHRGAANVMLLSVACATADRRMSYAEVISPDAVFQSDAEDSLRIAIRECSGPNGASEPAAPARSAPPSKHAPAPAAPTVSNTPPPDTAALRSQIVGTAGDSDYRLGYDGMGSYTFIDFLLVKSGWATIHLDTILFPGGPEAHRAQHPDKWLQWRRSRTGVEICTHQCDSAKRWRALAYGYISAPVAKGFRFAGAFKSIGGGSVGDSTALSYGFVSFSADGKFSNSSASSVSVNHWSPSTGTTGIASGGRASASTGGTYEVDGLLLTLRFDDGTVRYKTIMFTTGTKGSPTAPKAVTINGTMYNRM